MKGNSCGISLLTSLITFLTTHMRVGSLGVRVNEILRANEKFRGNHIIHNRAYYFWYYINNCRLIELGFKGSKFTWANKRYKNKKDLILERLDRCLASENWILSFPEASIHHLPRTHSDHYLMLINLSKYITIPLKPFRLELIWLSYHTFPNMVKGFFQNYDHLASAISHFESKIKVWNREVFGNIFQNKNTLFSRLAGIQRSNIISIAPFFTTLNQRSS